MRNILRINFFMYFLNFRCHALMMSVDSCHSATETFQINSIEPGHLSSYMQGMSISYVHIICQYIIILGHFWDYIKHYFALFFQNIPLSIDNTSPVLAYERFGKNGRYSSNRHHLFMCRMCRKSSICDICTVSSRSWPSRSAFWTACYLYGWG